jgi:tripartite-type tricarboxylate transporter receptor subunit TctC
MRKVAQIFAGVAFFAALVGCAQAAQSYPSRHVRLLVPFSAGSGSDTIGRIMAKGLAQYLAQQVIVDNRAGAAGNIGAELVAKSPPDGYTLLLVNMAHAASVSMYRNLPYDLRRDLAPVTQIATSPSIVVVHPSLPVNSIAGLVKLAKSKPGDLHYASGGIGTPTFVAGELFKERAGIDLLHVPYRSGGEAITAVVSGQVSIYFAPLASALGHIRQGRLRPLAVTSPKRVAVIPESPTVEEAGYPGYQAGNWYGLAVAAKTPQEIIAAIRGAALNALQSTETSKALIDLGYVLIGDDPEQFAAHINTEVDKLARILREIKS